MLPSQFLAQLRMSIESPDSPSSGRGSSSSSSSSRLSSDSVGVLVEGVNRCAAYNPTDVFDLHNCLPHSARGFAPPLGSSPPQPPFARRTAAYPVRSSIQHWQLRDLVHAISSTEFLYVRDSTIFRYDTTTSTKRSTLNLLFAPTCFTIGCGFLAAAGRKGEVVISDFDRVVYCGSLGDQINNGVHISRHCGDKPRLLLSCNSERVKVFDLGTMSSLSDIEFDHHVNYTAVSPDQRFMSCVGDSDSLSLFAVGSSGYERIDRMCIAPMDHSFCTAWSPSSLQVAATSQAGEVKVWDVRKTKTPIARLEANQRGRHRSLGACRTVKYCPGVAGLMAFAEHENFVHIVDCRAYFGVSQVIRLSPSIASQSISGIDFSPDGSKLFVGLEGHVIELEIDLLARRSFPDGDLC